MDDTQCGEKCPAGYYCERGTTSDTGLNPKKACPSKTYAPGKASGSESDCIKCLAGYLCQTAGTVDPTIDPNDSCQPGNYCRDGDSIICPRGHSCPDTALGSPIACPPGTYQNLEGEQLCKTCPEGYFCDHSEGPMEFDPTTRGDDFKCPQGYFCSAGTTHNNASPCPVGTYGNRTGVTIETDCTPCDPGKVISQ